MNVPAGTLVVVSVNEAVASVGVTAGPEAETFHRGPPCHHYQLVETVEFEPHGAVLAATAVDLGADKNVAEVEETITIAILVQNTMCSAQLRCWTRAHHQGDCRGRGLFYERRCRL